MIPETNHIISAIIGYYRNGVINETISEITDIPESIVLSIITDYLTLKNEYYVDRKAKVSI
jgi:hypothetical protein